jgi:hypothetical protein
MVINFDRKCRSVCSGIADQFRPEMVINFDRKCRSVCSGICDVLSTLASELRPMALDNNSRTLDEGGLQCQLSLINYYIDKGLIVQAVLMEREWLVNWLAWRSGSVKWLNRADRENIERTIGLIAQSSKRERPAEATIPSWYATLPEAQELAKLWDQLTHLRNDVAHCAMNDSPASSKSINDKARKISQSLEELFEIAKN